MAGDYVIDWSFYDQMLKKYYTDAKLKDLAFAQRYGKTAYGFNAVFPIDGPSAERPSFNEYGEISP